MKSFKKITKITLFLLLLMAFIFAIRYFFKVVYKLEGEAKVVEMKLPGETQNLKFALDMVNMEKLKWKDAVSIKGWVFRENVNSVKRDVFLVLKSKNKTLVFKIEKSSILRPDVSAGFHLAGGINNHGFELSVPLYLLKENTYQIGFVISDETGKYYSSSNLELRFLHGEVSVIALGLGSEFHSQQITLSIHKPTKEISYYFDKVEKNEKFLTVIGWGFLQGLDSKSLKAYILFRKNENVAIFNTDLQIRKDITIGFNKYGLNLDSTGFLAQIPTENLENGHYKIGLYIVKGNQTGMIYSDKYIDIGK